MVVDGSVAFVAVILDGAAGGAPMKKALEVLEAFKLEVVLVSIGILMLGFEVGLGIELVLVLVLVLVLEG